LDIGGVSQTQSYLQPGGYFPDGSPSTLTLGDGVQQIVQKNNRLQGQSMLSSTPLPPFSGQAFLSHTYCYVNCPNGGPRGNNGNIGQITDTLNATQTQSFTYDGLSRISSFTLGGTVMEQYNIDSFGNMKNILSPSAPNFGADNRVDNFTCASPATAGYDAAGNQVCDTDPVTHGVRQYSFNAEEQIAGISVPGNPPFETYTYGADGARVRKSNADGTFREYVSFNGQPLAEKDQTGAWTDYIYANAEKIARVEAFDMRAHLAGNRVDGSQTGVWGVYVLPLPSSPYLIKAGDKISFRQYQHNALGGLSIGFTDGSNSDWYCGADQLGDCIKGESRSNVWVNRTIDLGGMAAGKTISYIFLEDVQGSPQGLFDEEVADLTISSADGTVTQIIGRNALESLQGGTYRCGQVNAPSGWPTACALERLQLKWTLQWIQLGLFASCSLTTSAARRWSLLPVDGQSSLEAVRNLG